MIFEGVITTSNDDGGPHITPLGFRLISEQLELRPFEPSVTLTNLRERGQAVMNLTDDVRITAGCLTGRRDWPVSRCDNVDGWWLEGCYRHLELKVTASHHDPLRPTFICEVVNDVAHAAPSAFNRARAAVLEAAILVSRLDMLEPSKLEAELNYLHIAITKTAGERELIAWRWLIDAVRAHPGHTFEVGNLT